VPLKDNNPSISHPRTVSPLHRRGENCRNYRVCLAIILYTSWYNMYAWLCRPAIAERRPEVECVWRPRASVFRFRRSFSRRRDKSSTGGVKILYALSNEERTIRSFFSGWFSLFSFYSNVSADRNKCTCTPLVIIYYHYIIPQQSLYCIHTIIL